MNVNCNLVTLLARGGLGSIYTGPSRTQSHLSQYHRNGGRPLPPQNPPREGGGTLSHITSGVRHTQWYTSITLTFRALPRKGMGVPLISLTSSIEGLIKPKCEYYHHTHQGEISRVYIYHVQLFCSVKNG